MCREDTLTQLFLSSVRKGKEAEACLAAKALGMHVVTLGASKASEHIFGEVRRCAALAAEPVCVQHAAAALLRSSTSGSASVSLQAEPVLEPLIRNGKSGVTRAAAVEALSVLCFVGSEGATDTLHTMSTLWRIIVKGAMLGGGGGQRVDCHLVSGVMRLCGC